MRAQILFFCLAIFSSLSTAQASLDMGVGYSINTKNSLDSSLAIDNLVGVQASYDWADVNFGLELNYFEDSDLQVGVSSIERKYIDLVPWVRYNFVRISYVDLFFGVGSGAYMEKINVSVLDENVEEESKPHWLLAAALGVKFRLFDNFRPSFEYRVYRRLAAEEQNHGLRLALTYQYN